jgi:hypothetical protein
MGKFDVTSLVLTVITIPAGVAVYRYIFPCNIVPGVKTKLAQTRRRLDEAEAQDATFRTLGYMDQLAKYEMRRDSCRFCTE